MDYPRIYPYTKTIPPFFLELVVRWRQRQHHRHFGSFLRGPGGTWEWEDHEGPRGNLEISVGKVSSNQNYWEELMCCNPVSSQKKSWKGWEDYTFVEVSFPFPIFSPIFPS